MQLTFDPDVEAFRAEFVAFLDEHVPATAAEALERPKSVSHMPAWARRWQRLLFDNGWLLPTQPPLWWWLVSWWGSSPPSRPG